MRLVGNFTRDGVLVSNKVMSKPMARDARYALNAICPYFTMFPLEFPYRLLRRAGQNSLALDPFCGRGTTNYAARRLGLQSFGIDSSPIAVAIARAKLSSATKAEVMDLAREILAGPGPKRQPAGEFWALAFESDTLYQLCQLREALLNRRSESADLLRAVVLGCLHGPSNSSPKTASYFSNQMLRTFASKPNYSVRFWRERRMLPRKIDVLGPIARKLDRVFLKEALLQRTESRIRLGNSTRASSYQNIPDRITHVITSPPYYGLVTYVEDQWLRNWFIGGPDTIEYGNRKQLSHKSPKDFAMALSKVWSHCGRLLTSDGQMVVRFGSIGSRNCDARGLFRESLELSSHQWRVTHVKNVGSADSGKRQADTIGTKTKPKTEFDFVVRPA